MVVELPRCTLVTGPASSGKSVWAERLAGERGLPVTYVATGPELPDDADWQQRLQRHRQRRPADWESIEVGLALPQALVQTPATRLLLIDSLGTWVAAGLALETQAWAEHCDALSKAIVAAPNPLILVAEEAAWGVVPSTASGGRFRRRLGELLQLLMPLCDGAWLVLHGRAVDLLAISQPGAGPSST